MGYPAVGCEAFYRNNINDVRNFLTLYHKEVKVIYIFYLRFTISALKKQEYIQKKDFLIIKLDYFHFMIMIHVQ